MIRNYLLFGAVLLAFALLAVPVSAQTEDVDKNTTEANSSASNQTVNSSSSEFNLTQDNVLQYARDGRNISRDRAQRAYNWFNQNQGDYSSSEREIVQSWATAQLANQTTEPTQNNSTESRSFIFSDNQRYEQYNYGSERNDTYQAAIEAIKDGEIRENELADYYQTRQERITPRLDLQYVEWQGNQTTLIIKAEEETTLSLNDGVLASQEYTRSAPKHTVELNKGLNVVQLPTVRSQQRGIECVSFSTTDSVNMKCSGEPVNLVSWFKSFISVGNVIAATLLGAVTYYIVRTARLKYRSYKKKSEIATRWV